MTVSAGQRAGMLIVVIAGLGIYGLSLSAIRRPAPGKSVPWSNQGCDSTVVELCGIRGEGIYFLPPVADSQNVIDAACIKEPGYRKTLQAATIFRGACLDFSPAGSLRVGAVSAAKRLALGVALDVNGSSAADLALVPGIGDSDAFGIVQLRTEKGKFSNLSELADVPGIKGKKLEKIKSYLSIDLNR